MVPLPETVKGFATLAEAIEFSHFGVETPRPVFFDHDLGDYMVSMSPFMYKVFTSDPDTYERVVN